MTVRVTDNGSPSLSATQTFTITVNEVNNAPSLAPLLSRTINEGSLLLVTNSASDPDSGGQLLTFSLDPGFPAGMTIDAATGVIAWVPSEIHGPGTYVVTLRVTDDGDPPLSDTKPLTVFVVEVNTPPQLAPIPDRLVPVGRPVTFSVSATDDDFPAQGLTYSLEPGAPPGAVIDGATGAFSWTPGPAAASTTNGITVTVADHGSPPLAASHSFNIVVMPELTAAVERQGDVVIIRVPSVPGHTYRLEYKDSLSDSSWTQLGDDMLATAADVTFTDSSGGQAQRFYRVLLAD
jgi:hypothetical protein